jgi:TatD DNase family protein
MNFIDAHAHKAPSSSVFSIQNIRLGHDAFDLVDSKGFFSLGLHPWDIDSHQASLKDLPKFARFDSVLCVGETGLDRAMALPLGQQTQVFEEHIVVSEMLRKPLVVHCVRAYNEIHRIRKQNQCRQNWLLHGFQASEGMLLQLLRLEGVFFSFGKGIFSPKNAHLFRQLPDERILLETDESDLKIEDVYAQAAQIKGLSLDQLSQIVQKNFETFLGEAAQRALMPHLG